VKVLEKKVMIEHKPERAPICGFATYISATEPVLLRRCGWEVGDDVHDDFYDLISRDNGQTWEAPIPSLRSTAVAGGFMVFVENSAIFLEKRNRLVTITDLKFEPSLEGAHGEYSAQLHITVRDPNDATEAQPFVSDFGIRQGLYVSFCHPVEDSRGRLLVPVMWQKVDDGSIQQRGFPTRPDLPDVLMDVWEVALLIGEFDANGEIVWNVGNAVPCEFGKSSRGMNEGTVAELQDGRLAMVLRGSNVGWPDKPGYKWLSFSSDGGTNWTEPIPLPCDDGSTPESSATGSALFRSIKNGRLYWIGNLCLHGERASGNFPRSPLVIAEVQEEPFALRRDSITIIDERAPHEDAGVQMSNFRFYQDRLTGDTVLYLTRYGERGSHQLDWMMADNYQYRVSVE